MERLANGDVGKVCLERRRALDRYATSKLANILTVEAVASRVSADRIGVFGYDPGLVPGTGLIREQPGVVRALFRGVSPILSRLPGASTPQRSGATLAWLATTPELQGATGAHLDFTRGPATIWKRAVDPDFATQLYQESLAFLDLRDRIAPPPSPSPTSMHS